MQALALNVRYGSMATLRDRFNFLKTEKDVSLEEIARSINSNKSSLSMFINGKLNIKKDMIEALANYFDVDVSYLMGESNVRRIDQSQIVPNKVKWLQDAMRETTLTLLTDLESMHLTPDQVRIIVTNWVKINSEIYDEKYGK